MKRLCGSFGCRQVGEISTRELDDFLRALKVGASSKNSIRKRVVTLFGWCRDQGYLKAENPTAAEKTGSFAETDKAPEIFTPGEMRKLLSACGAEERIRTKLLKDDHIDTVIGLPANLFYSTGIPVCILVLKKCKKPDDVLFINAAEHFVKGKRQNQLTDEHIAKIIATYQFRKEEPRYSRRVEMAEIEKNDFNLNISRYISTAVGEAEIDLLATHAELMKIERAIKSATAKHNEFLKELGIPPLPSPD